MHDPSVPRFGGLSGKPLQVWVSVVATCGFLLFGYDRELLCAVHQTADIPRSLDF